MKNSEIASAVIGTTFFAVPYLALAIPLVPSIAIGAAAFAAGELVFNDAVKEKLKETNYPLYLTLKNGYKDVNTIREKKQMIDDPEIVSDLEEIEKISLKIIKTIEKEPDKEHKLKNFFDYYLPVTVKLVERYDTIEDQKINSNDVKKFQENTKKTIKEIKEVFNKFLNNLYESDMMDTKVEIKVLNSMLKADGLDKNDLDKELKKEDPNE